MAWYIVAALHVTNARLFSQPRCLSIHGFVGSSMHWTSADCVGAGLGNHSNLVSFMQRVDGEGVLRTALDLVYKCPALRGPPLPVPLALRLGLAPELLVTLLAGLVLVRVLVRCIGRRNGPLCHTLACKRE